MITADMMWGLSGLIVGLLGGGFGLYYGRKKAAKARGLDERHQEITRRALANAWRISLLGLVLLMITTMLGFTTSAMQVVSLLYLVHMAGWAFSYFYYNSKL